jgi:hypothetical protein
VKDIIEKKQPRPSLSGHLQAQPNWQPLLQAQEPDWQRLLQAQEANSHPLLQAQEPNGHPLLQAQEPDWPPQPMLHPLRNDPFGGLLQQQVPPSTAQ